MKRATQDETFNAVLSRREERIIRLAEVKHRTGLSRSTIYALLKAGQFPSQIPLGARSVGWSETAISAWVAARLLLADSQPRTTPGDK